MLAGNNANILTSDHAAHAAPPKNRAVALAQKDPDTAFKVTPEKLFLTFQKLTDENLQVKHSRPLSAQQYYTCTWNFSTS